jgi:hypothetical protein
MSVEFWLFNAVRLLVWARGLFEAVDGELNGERGMVEGDGVGPGAVDEQPGVGAAQPQSAGAWGVSGGYRRVRAGGVAGCAGPGAAAVSAPRSGGIRDEFDLASGAQRRLPGAPVLG